MAAFTAAIAAGQRSYHRPVGGRTVLTGQRILIGVGAIVSSVLYVASDVIELAAGRLSTGQLVVTYLAEALIPFFILGLHGAQHPEGGWLSLMGALLFGFAFVGFSATVLYPLVTGTRDADAVFDDFGAIYTAHAVLALIGGLLFAASVLRARVFPTWTAYTLAAGLLITTVFVLLGVSEAVQTLGTAVRSVAFAAMGIVCLRTQGFGWRSTHGDVATSMQHDRAGEARHESSSLISDCDQSRPRPSG